MGTWATDLIGRASSALEKVAERASRVVETHDHIRRLPASGTVPVPRESHSITAIGSKLYVFGGYDGARPLNDLYVFDTHAGLWTQLVHTGISPAARAGHSATALGMPAHLVVFGGANASRRFADVQLFDTGDSHWTKPAVRGRPPSARYYHAACLARGALLVFGGSDGSQNLADLHALNAESWTWSQPITNGQSPTPRCGHTGTLVNKLFFIIGGVGDSQGATGELNDFYVLDTESWSWWRPDPSPLLPPIAYHAAVLTADKIFVYGGSTRDQLYNDVLMLDTSTCQWQPVQNGDAAKLPRRRRLGAARGAGTRMLVFGGWDGTHTCADMLEIDTSGWLLGGGGAAAQPAAGTQPSAAGSASGGMVARRPVVSKGTAIGGGGGSGEHAYPVLPGGVGFGSSGSGEGLEVAMERLEEKHEEELQRLRGEVARLRMSNELMGREMSKLKTIVGASMPGEFGGVDVDALASRKEVEALRAEVAKLRRLRDQERELDQGTTHAEIESLKRMVHALSMRLADVTDGQDRHAMPRLS